MRYTFETGLLLIAALWLVVSSGTLPGSGDHWYDARPYAQAR